MDKQSLKQKVFGTRKAPSLGSKLVMGVFITAVALVSLAVITTLWANRDNQKVDDNTYQAVFLQNGQVYFGRLSNVNREYVVLTDVYYLQNKAADQAEGEAATQNEAAADSEATKEGESQLQLNKLGSELHGPQNQMFIVQDNISFWENLKSDSKVVEAIKNQDKDK